MMKVAKEYTLSERFEVAFNRIHESLKKMIKINTDKFSALVRHGSKHKVISTFHEELYQYSKLRNALVHDKTKLGFYVAEPHPEVVARIEKIAEILQNPIMHLQSQQKMSSVLTMKTALNFWSIRCVTTPTLNIPSIKTKSASVFYQPAHL
ncbi:hypothetical protein ACTWQL_14950 [Pseudalkalibacillus sp. R45]|uniref:hypothetical protein n=1 Tax=Pseudalkalibacillus sp. R45 TaxID=3457433 RepID=UPI003FCC3A87